MTENFAFDLADVIAGQKIVSELTREGKYYYLAKYYCPKNQNSFLKNNVSKEEKLERINFNVSAFVDSKQTMACLQ